MKIFDGSFSSSQILPLPLPCAWCLQEQGIVPVDGSHGICKSHAAALLRTYAQRRRERMKDKPLHSLREVHA